MLVFCTVISDILYLDVSLFLIMMKACFVDNNIVFCLVILFMHSTNAPVCLALLVCDNLISFCNFLMFVFILFNTVMFLLLYYIVT